MAQQHGLADVEAWHDNQGHFQLSALRNGRAGQAYLMQTHSILRPPVLTLPMLMEGAMPMPAT